MCSANRDEPSDAHGGAGWGLLTLRWRVEQQRDLLKGVTTSTINILSSSCTLYSQTGMTYHPQGYKNKHMSSFSGHIWHFKTFSQAGKWVNSTSLIITAWRSRCRGGEAPDIQTLTHRELPSVWVQLLQCCCSPTCSRALWGQRRGRKHCYSYVLLRTFVFQPFCGFKARTKKSSATFRRLFAPTSKHVGSYTLLTVYLITTTDCQHK